MAFLLGCDDLGRSIAALIMERTYLDGRPIQDGAER